MGLLHRVALALRGAQDEGPRVGRYRIIRRLAEGGMGEIFLARAVGRSGFEKVVVLKRILPNAMADREAVRMFLDEARLMATLSHPNVVQVYDFGTARGAHFFTMEYVHGQDVGHISKASAGSGRPLSLEFALGVIAEAAAGLHYAHEKRGKDGAPLNIVHRDISPSNVLVSYDGAVKLTDFGIAKWAKRETETRYGALKGKIAYMSPEQCRGEPLDRRSDVFGLGILLFELTTGSRLYQGTSDFAILDQIVNREPPRPSSRVPDYPASIERIVMRALDRDPGRRFQSARELQLALEELAMEARAKLSAVARAAEMEALFDQQIGAWREAVQAGRSLGEYLTDTAAGVPLMAPVELVSHAGAAPALTGTRPEGGAVIGVATEAPTVGTPFTARGQRRPRLAISLGVAGVLGATALTLALRPRPPRFPSGSAPATTVAPARPAPPPASPEPTPEVAASEQVPSTATGEGTSAAAASPTAWGPERKGPGAKRRKRGGPEPTPPPPGTKAPAGKPPAAAQKTKIWDPDSVILP